MTNVVRRPAAVALLAATAAGAAAQVGAARTDSAHGRIPGARAVRACTGAGAFWPTMTLAVSGGTAWVACKEQSRVVRVNLPGGRRTASTRLGGRPIAVAVGLGAVWALDSGSTLYRLHPRTARVTRRTSLGASAAYNLWIGGGSLWVADDRGARVLRISPATGRVVARVPVGDGPADIAFDGERAWVVGHRDNTLFRVDLATNDATRIATLGVANDAAVERIALLGGALWATGRGAPLLEIDPESGAVRRSVDIGGTGIDLAVSARDLWVPVRTAEVDRTGFPTMTAVRRVTTSGAVSTAATASGRVDVHGLAVASGRVWLADNRAGFVYRLPA